MRRSRLATPGGWALVEMPGEVECANCWRVVDAGWVNVPLEVAVCFECLPDPWKPEPHEVKLGEPTPVAHAGEVMAAQLRKLYARSA